MKQLDVDVSPPACLINPYKTSCHIHQMHCHFIIMVLSGKWIFSSLILVQWHRDGQTDGKLCMYGQHHHKRVSVWPWSTPLQEGSNFHTMLIHWINMFFRHGGADLWPTTFDLEPYDLWPWPVWPLISTPHGKYTVQSTWKSSFYMVTLNFDLWPSHVT